MYIIFEIVVFIFQFSCTWLALFYKEKWNVKKNIFIWRWLPWAYRSRREASSFCNWSQRFCNVWLRFSRSLVWSEMNEWCWKRKKKISEDIYHVRIVLKDRLILVGKVFEMFVNDLIIHLVVFEDSKYFLRYQNYSNKVKSYSIIQT